jgi:hypothetical protein
MKKVYIVSAALVIVGADLGPGRHRQLGPGRGDLRPALRLDKLATCIVYGLVGLAAVYQLTQLRALPARWGARRHAMASRSGITTPPRVPPWGHWGHGADPPPPGGRR